MIKNLKIIEHAKRVFNKYASLDYPHLLHHGQNPDSDIIELTDIQILLSRWQKREYPAADIDRDVIALIEEVGELAHAVNKNFFKLRGLEDTELFRARAGDAIADSAILLIQICTKLRLDFWWLLKLTAEEVMTRKIHTA